MNGLTIYIYCLTGIIKPFNLTDRVLVLDGTYKDCVGIVVQTNSEETMLNPLGCNQNGTIKTENLNATFPNSYLKLINP